MKALFVILRQSSLKNLSAYHLNLCYVMNNRQHFVMMIRDMPTCLVSTEISLVEKTPIVSSSRAQLVLDIFGRIIFKCLVYMIR